MADITITITADEDDLRTFVRRAPTEHRRVVDAIAAALPKPSIVVRPGMVLRRNGDGSRWMAYLDREPKEHVRLCPTDIASRLLGPGNGLDPAEWTVILDAEDTP